MATPQKLVYQRLVPSQTGRHALSEFSRQERSEAGIGVVSGPVPPGDGSPPEAATDIRPNDRGSVGEVGGISGGAGEEDPEMAKTTPTLLLPLPWRSRQCVAEC